MNIFNRYSYLLILLITVAGISLYLFLPSFETEEFDQEVIDNIIEGVTTTTIISNETEVSENLLQENEEERSLQITEQEIQRIEEILENNKRIKIEAWIDSGNGPEQLSPSIYLSLIHI